MFEPIQLPIIAQVASCNPRGTMNRVAVTSIVMTWAASYVTPRVPARMVRISNAHHSLQIITVVGNDTLRYSPQPLNASESIGTRA